MKKKKNITIVASSLTGNGGTENVISSILADPKICNHFEFSLFLPFGVQQFGWISERKNLKKLYSLPFQGFGGVLSRSIRLIFSFAFYSFCNSEVLMISNPRQIKIAKLAKKFFNKKYSVVSWMHFSLFGVKTVNAKLIMYAEKHLAISTGIAEQLVKMGASTDDIYTIYNPVKSTDERIQRTVNLGVKELLYVGRVQFQEQKNLKFMIQGLSKLNLRWHLNIIGDGKGLNKLRKYSEELGVGKQITFNGWNNKPWDRLKSVDVLLLTSNSEGFGMVLTEAISRGIPVVSSDCPVGPADIVQNGINGETYELNNIDDFENKVKKVLDIKYTDMDKIAGSLDWLYDDCYSTRFIRALTSINKNVVKRN